MILFRMIKKQFVLLLTAILTCCLFSGLSSARSLEERVDDLEKKQQDAEKKLEELESQKSSLAKEIWKEFFFADTRFRQETVFKQGSPDRYRYRVRLRAGLYLPMHEKVLVGIRMVTGATNDPTTGNVDLDGYFSKKDFNIDRLFIEYRPFSSLTLTGGKFANLFEHVEFVFHNDVQFEGAAEQFHFNDVGFIDQVQFNFGEFVLDEIKNADDTNLFAGQVFFKGFALKGLSFGAILYEYRNENNIAQAVEDGILAGGDTNTRIGAGTGTSSYKFGFRIFETMVKYKFKINSFPLWVIGAYAQNFHADANEEAYWAEIGLGPIPNLNKLKAHYHYVRVEKDSMISNYNNADIFDPNMQGHEIKLAMPVASNITVETLYF